MSKAKQLAQALSDRLATISVANGYLTDIGTTVMRGKLDFDEKELPCIVIVEGDDEVLDERDTDARVNIPFQIEGHDIGDPTNPNDKIHDILADLKRAIFGTDTTFGGLIRASRGTPGLHYRGRIIYKRDAGTANVAAGIRIDCEITENLANP
jgi:hypothetical protein